MVESGLTQFVDFPTRGCNILDIVLADDKQIINQIVFVWDPPIGNSDHMAIKIPIAVQTTAITTSCITENIIKYNWYKADFELMQTLLDSVDWLSLFCFNPSALCMWNALMSVLRDVIDVYVCAIDCTDH